MSLNAEVCPALCRLCAELRAQQQVVERRMLIHKAPILQISAQAPTTKYCKRVGGNRHQFLIFWEAEKVKIKVSVGLITSEDSFQLEVN